MTEIKGFGYAGKEAFLQKLNAINYAIFDMDGTIIRPGLLVFDVMVSLFQEKNDDYKLRELKMIYESYKVTPFDESYRRFLGLLKDENKKSLQEIVENRLNAKLYPYAKLTIKKLRDKYGIKSYLISLTTDFVADFVKVYFGFEGTYNVRCISNTVGDKELFNGEVAGKLSSAAEMKTVMFKDLEKKMADKPFLCFFDSGDDIPIARNAELKVGINQSEKLKNEIKTDLSLSGKDPWEEFYNIL
jgi:phosphoserine phosphatase